jgi:hypothetical protein
MAMGEFDEMMNEVSDRVAHRGQRNAVDAKRAFMVDFAEGSEFLEKVNQMQEADKRLVLLAVERILPSNRETLLADSWLKDLGAGLYELRVGPTRFKAAKRAGDDLSEIVNATLLFRIFCAYEFDGYVTVLGCYDKTTDRRRERQKEEIDFARKQLERAKS